MLREPFDDVFEVPFFTQEFCDKMVENLKSIPHDEIERWGTNMMGVLLEDINFKRNHATFG